MYFRSGSHHFMHRVLVPPVFLLVCAVFLSGCAETRLATDLGKGQRVGVWKIGKPYQINGQWYYPSEDWSYRKEGIASWYGGEFGGKETANGEIFDPNALTAAHKTLPLPTLVRVTNLENGRALVVRINDRGPFSGDRLIDMSRRGAQLLGFSDSGTARVRVEILEKESRVLKARAIAGHADGMPEVAAAPRPEVKRGESLAPAQMINDTKSQAKHEAKSLVKAVPPALKSSTIPKQSRPVHGAKPGTFWIQAGAFSSRASAESLSKRLATIHAGEISSAKVKSKTMFRVRLGPFKSKEEAKKMLPRLKKIGIEKPRLVTE